MNCGNALICKHDILGGDRPKPPEILEIQPSRTMEVEAGERIQLFCSVQINSEEANVSWMKNGQVIAYGATLYLDNLSEQDSGEVICRAENSFGTAEQTAYIYVRPGKYQAMLSSVKIVKAMDNCKACFVVI